jgi:hypothetical protein
MPIPSRTLAVLLAFAVAATAGYATTGGASSDDSTMYGRTYGAKPEPNPSRTISEQDCLKPIVLDGGNLRCK